MIEPTVGRVVLYHPVEGDPGYMPGVVLAALVCRVERDELGDFRLNLAVFAGTGRQYSREFVLLWQKEGVGDPPEAPFAAWMEYQKGQAAKAEEVGERLAGRVERLESALTKLVEGLPGSVEAEVRRLTEGR